MWPYDQTQYHPMPQQNPYLNAMRQAPQMQVPRVSGRGGAEAYPMGPNSSALLLDESGTLVWAVTTDSAGYKTTSPYDITPHLDAPPPDITGFETRLKRLEEIVHGTSGNPAAVGDSQPGAGAIPANGAAPAR